MVLTAARLRERLGVPGMSVRHRQRLPRQAADEGAGRRRWAAGAARDLRVRTAAEARAGAAQLGYPLVLKPIAGAGSADTHRVDDDAELEAGAQADAARRPRQSCEEFIEGEEFTFDTVCIGGQPAFRTWRSTCPSRSSPAPTSGSARSSSPCAISSSPSWHRRLALGRGGALALNMGDGFTHMEWFRKPKGEVVFGEIGCRPGGAHLVDQMNYTCDIDLFREWARVSCWGRFEAPTTRKYNVAIIFKRAKGQGRITRITGLREFLRRHGEHVVEQQAAAGRHAAPQLEADARLRRLHPAPPPRLAHRRRAGQHGRDRRHDVRGVAVSRGVG
jgi:biotin carboxylase